MAQNIFVVLPAVLIIGGAVTALCAAWALHRSERAAPSDDERTQ